MMCKRNIDRLPLVHTQLGTWPATQAHTLTKSVRRPTLNPLSHTSQGNDNKHLLSDVYMSSTILRIFKAFEILTALS